MSEYKTSSEIPVDPTIAGDNLRPGHHDPGRLAQENSNSNKLNLILKLR